MTDLDGQGRRADLPRMAMILWGAGPAGSRRQRPAVWIAEGEKDADTLAALGQLATTNAQGADNFPDELAAQFAGLSGIIAADRDLRRPAQPARASAPRVSALPQGR